MQEHAYSSYYRKMNIKYIYHSGFLILTEKCNIIIDYYKGELPTLETDKPVVVMASHAHKDHYNPEIFDMLRKLGITDITAVLGKDIKPELHPEGIETIRARMHQEYEVCGTKIYTIQSTDSGVGYLIEVDGIRLFHAGDYNIWDAHNKQMIGMFRHELEVLRDRLKGAPLDALFYPLDPRLYDSYAVGALEFLEKITVNKLYPMHFWEHPEVIGSFIKAHPQYADIVVDYAEDVDNG